MGRCDSRHSAAQRPADQLPWVCHRQLGRRLQPPLREHVPPTPHTRYYLLPTKVVPTGTSSYSAESIPLCSLPLSLSACLSLSHPYPLPPPSPAALSPALSTCPLSAHTATPFESRRSGDGFPACIPQPGKPIDWCVDLNNVEFFKYPNALPGPYWDVEFFHGHSQMSEDLYARIMGGGCTEDELKGKTAPAPLGAGCLALMAEMSEQVGFFYACERAT